jgi:methionyl-tRNA formyltransferase
MSPSAHTPDPAADSHAASAVPEIEVAFFGKTHEPLSLFGLRTVAAEPGLRVRSLTCRRRPGTEPTGPLIDLAKELDIPVRTFEDLAADATPPDLVISFSNSIVFPGDFIERVPLGIVNMHPAPLPAFRGNDSIEHLLMNGETTFGATLHYCDSGIDTGPIIELCEFPVEAEDNATSVWAKVDRAAEAGLRRLLPLLVAAGRRGERVPAHPQSSAGSRFYPVHAVPETCELDPGASWEDTVRLVRAYDHPRRTPAYFRSGDSRVEVGWRGGQIAVLGVSALAEADR